MTIENSGYVVLLAAGLCFFSVSGCQNESRSDVLPASPVAASAAASALSMAPRQLTDVGKTNLVLKQLHQGNLDEIAAGKLAQERAHNAELKAYAQEIVSDHSSLDQKLTELAKQMNLDLATIPQDPVETALSLSAEDRKRSLGALSGGAFDVAFLAPQVDLHTFALRLLDEGERTATGDAKKLIQEARPMIDNHRERAKNLERGLSFSPTAIGGGPASSAEMPGGTPTLAKADAGHPRAPIPGGQGSKASP